MVLGTQQISWLGARHVFAATTHAANYSSIMHRIATLPTFIFHTVVKNHNSRNYYFATYLDDLPLCSLHGHLRDYPFILLLDANGNGDLRCGVPLPWANHPATLHSWPPLAAFKKRDFPQESRIELQVRQDIQKQHPNAKNNLFTTTTHVSQIDTLHQKLSYRNSLQLVTYRYVQNPASPIDKEPTSSRRPLSRESTSRNSNCQNLQYVLKEPSLKLVSGSHWVVGLVNVGFKTAVSFWKLSFRGRGVGITL